MQWRPGAIQVRLARGQVGMQVAPHLHLIQKLQKSESGWTMMKIELPSSWQVSRAKVVDGEVVVVRKSGETYRLGPSNVGPLSFAILDGGEKSAAELAKIWEKHARAKA